MANIRKKIINTWDGGIQTSSREIDTDTSYGAQLVKHFDIYSDPKKLSPMPSWDSFTTDAEKAYNIRAIGGLSDTVYGLGSALLDWYSSNWSYRVEVNHSISSDVIMFDLGAMPATFWDNVNENGSDIRVVDKGTGVLKGCDVKNFDRTAEEGQIWTNASSDFYIYYGNANATANTDMTITTTAPFLDNSEKAYDSLAFMYHFDGDVTNAKNASQSLSSGTPVYTTVGLGQSLTACEVVGGESGIGNDMLVGFRIFVPASNTGVVDDLISDSNGNWSIEYTSGDKIAMAVNGTSSNPTLTSTNAIAKDTLHTVFAHFHNGSLYIYTDGTLNGSNITSAGNVDGTQSTLRVETLTTTGGNVILDTLFGINYNADAATFALDYHNMLTNNSAQFTVGTETALTSTAKQYGGLQIYSKSISSGDWSEYFLNGMPAKDTTVYPVNGFVETSSDLYFISSQSEDEGGFMFLSKTNSFGSSIVDGSHLLLTTNVASNKVRPTAESPVDKSIYFTYNSSNIGEVGDPGSSNIFGAYSTAISMSAWRNYLAIGSSRRTRANVELWDLTSSNPTEFIDAGTGNLRIVGNASDILFAVVDNYIDDAVLSSGKPTMEVKEYVGNGRMEPVVKMQIPTTYTGWADNWERAVSFFKVRRNEQTLFYAKLPANATATEWNQGFWAVGKNSEGKLALSLMLDTSEFDAPENVHGFAQQVFYVEKDGGIQRLATDGSYNKTSLYRTRLMNEGNSEIEKKLHGVEIVTEPLAEGQTITAYYRLVGETDRVEIGEFTGTGEIATEFVTDADGNNLPHYQEIEFEIESTGGASAILEFNYRYEYLSDLI